MSRPAMAPCGHSLLLPTVIALVGLLAAPTCQAENLLQNPGFEPPATEVGLAQGWLPNVWGHCDTVFSLDRQNPHSGQTCQRIECRSRTSGASQFLQPLDIEAGRRYVVRMWVRAEGHVPEVGASLRHSPPPYTKHLRGTFEPGRDWELFEIEGTTLESDDNAGLYIWFEAQDTGTVWIDDASVETHEPEAIGGPPPEGNVVPHGSFEVDVAHHWDVAGAEPRWPCEEHVAHGRRSIRFDLQAEDHVSLTTPCIEFGAGDEPFTLAISAAATGGPVELRVHLHSAVRISQAQPVLELTAQPDETLRRLSATGAVAPSLNGAYYLTVSGTAQGAATLWLDALSLSTAGAEYEPSAPVEASLTTDAFACIFAPGQPKVLTLQVHAGSEAVDETIAVRVRDYRERVVAEVPVPVHLAPGETLSRPVELPLRELGAFRADAHLGDDPEPLASVVLSVIPRPRNVPPEQSVIGGHFATHSDWQMRAARRLGYRWTRIHDCSSITHWRTAEPEPDQWRFFDDQVERVRDAGLHILGEFLRVPDWGTVAEEGSDAQRRGVGPYRDEDEFRRYVRTVVGHYRPWIRHWEVWNEPYHNGFYGGTAAQYARMAQVAAEAAREVNPACVVLAPCCSPNVPDWAAETVAAGALDGATIFSYHGYGCQSRAPYDRVRSWATRHGSVMPRWNTETGLTATSFYRFTPDRLESQYTRRIGGLPVGEAVHLSLQYFALSIASGSERYFYYWTNVEPRMLPRLSAMSIYEWDRTIRPHGVVYSIAAWLLDPCEGAGVEEYDSGITACYLRTADRFVAVIWARTKLSASRFALDLPDDAQLLDTMGNRLPLEDTLEVTKAPVYVLVSRSSAQRLRAALRAALAE
ncbi:MAG: hypothetical protein U9R79_00020 [Armatimonadota bacterium]|nr:hypothetical protein [Armatimonadota bacterium]